MKSNKLVKNSKGGLKTRQQIREEINEVFKLTGNHIHGGMSTFFQGWIACTCACIFLFACVQLIFGIPWNWIFLVGSMLIGLLYMFMDSEDVKRNTLITVENRFTNEKVCNFVTGRHWTKFFFFRRRGTYDNTPNEISLNIPETISSDDIPLSGKVKLLIMLVDGFAAEDQGVDDVINNISTEAIDRTQAFIKRTSVDEIEAEDNAKVEEFLLESKDLLELIHRSGYILLKVDIIDVSPSEEYQNARSKAKIAMVENKAKRIDLRQFTKIRIAELKIDKLLTYIPGETETSLKELAKKKIPPNSSEEQILAMALAIAREKALPNVEKEGKFTLKELEQEALVSGETFEGKATMTRVEGFENTNASPLVQTGIKT
jgi:hypothetical protein